VRAGPSSGQLTALSKPDWVGSVFDWPGVWRPIRLALVSAYLVGGLINHSDSPAAVTELAHFGLTPPQLWAVLAIMLELGGRC
jgi:hypothetical protein